MSPEEASLLASALKRAMRESAFWRARMADLGVRAEDLGPSFPLRDLPPISKLDLLADQVADPPFGRLLAVDPESIRRIHRTSGTSATPFFIALTDRDIADTYVSSERAFRIAGMGPGDRVVHCLNFNMWSGGVTDYIAIERVHATAIPFGVGNTSLLLQLIKTLRINAISSTPSYMFSLRDRCRDELGIDPTALGLRRGYFGGEGLLQVPGVRQTIENDFGMVAIDANYGMSEIQSVIGGEGPERDGLVNHTYGILLTELIDANGNSVPVEPGATGELVFSTLRREAQPLFRYRSNDLAEILWAETGEDGLKRMRFQILGRTDQMLVLKGVNFFPQSLMSVVSEFPDELGSAFRVLRPPSGPVSRLEVVMETSLAESAHTALAAAIEQRISALLQVRTHVHLVPLGTLPREDNKSNYIIDSFSAIPKVLEHLGTAVQD
jgi:phenylacetate-CoA ligase